jgi:hypothetical protein
MCSLHHPPYVPQISGRGFTGVLAWMHFGMRQHNAWLKHSWVPGMALLSKPLRWVAAVGAGARGHVVYACK